MRSAAGTENLAVEAARALAEEAGVAPAARIRLHKALPVAAGIGGGSADAAADPASPDIRFGGCRSRRTGLPRSRWISGPTFRSVSSPGRAWCAVSANESRRRPRCPPSRWCWSNPMIPLATAAVFAAREGAFSEPVSFDGDHGDAAALAKALENTRNDLARAAERICPEIRLVLDAIRATPSCLLARLSGSGPTCFGLFPTRETPRPWRPGGSRPPVPDGGCALPISARFLREGRHCGPGSIEPIFPVARCWGVAKR